MTTAPGTVKRALLSVYDKRGLVEFAKGLADLGVELLASGGTARTLQEAGINVIPVEKFTGAPEVLGGRVKTLHPRIHAGILADRRQEDHLMQLKRCEYPTIDLVACNLYPFEDKLESGADHDTLIETIDIGGPTLVRATAKNCDGGATILCESSDYSTVLSLLQSGGAVPQDVRRALAAKAFRHVAHYDMVIASWTESMARANDSVASQELPSAIGDFEQVRHLRYGENPQQAAALYLDVTQQRGVAHGSQLGGKELSYNNYLDLDAAYRAACLDLDEPRCAIVKHTNPCGLAVHQDQAEAFRRALAGDPVSAFGSIIGFNQPLTGVAAEAIRESKLFVECIVAPGFTQEAKKALEKRANLRMLEVPKGDPAPSYHLHRIGGGLLVQQTDDGVGNASAWECVTKKTLEPGWLEELKFAMQATALLKSNAIAITKDRQLWGAGTGQMSRVDATEHAITKAGDNCTGAFLGSDAFFPFADCVKLAHSAGIVAIVQPGGSKRDQESIDACDELGLAMVFSRKRHFRH